MSEKKYKIGFTVGVFDLFHVGHLNLLEKCKKQCDYLIVAVCGDDYVTEIKHKVPVYSESERLRIINALKCVDMAIPISIEAVDDKRIVWKEHHFDVLFSGDDWKGSERYKRTEAEFAELGVAIEYLPYTKGISTSQIKDTLKNNK